MLVHWLTWLMMDSALLWKLCTHLLNRQWMLGLKITMFLIRCLKRLYRRQRDVMNKEKKMSIKKNVGDQKDQNKIVTLHFMGFPPALRKQWLWKIGRPILDLSPKSILSQIKMVTLLSWLEKWDSFLLWDQMFLKVVRRFRPIIISLATQKTHGILIILVVEVLEVNQGWCRLDVLRLVLVLILVAVWEYQPLLQASLH